MVEIMRAISLTALWALAAMLDASRTPAQPSPAAADPDAGWETYLEIKKLSFDFAASPEKATMSGPGWTILPKVPALPPELRRRTFVNDSYLLVDIDSLGRAAACRPLRASALPRLDVASCDLLKRPDDFSVYLPPGAHPMQMVIGVRWRRVGPDSPRITVAPQPPQIVPTPRPPPPKRP
ncbi:MAG: hypothetical protein ACJ8ER_03785 [Allosphingosinicella sp.]